MATITALTGRRVWDSRGRPTVEAEVVLDTGARGRAIAPAGASRGLREAVDLRDGGPHLGGRDVGRALAALREVIAPALTGLDARDQQAVDAAIRALDPSRMKERLGGNATTAVSLAVLHAGAAAKGVPLWRHVADLAGTVPLLPLPEIQIFGGGAHAGRRVDIQDFMVMVPGATSFDEVMEITHDIYFAAGDIMARRGRLAGVADEGGWWPEFSSNEEALETLVEAITLASEKPGERVVISLDVAASEFGQAGRYRLALEDRALDTGGMIDLLGRWLDAWPIAAIEDPLGEDDRAGMVEFTRRFGDKVQVIGDDYLVTDAALVRAAVQDGACNAVLVKVNQAGTVTEALDAAAAARGAGWAAVVSARSGESEDVSISHIATGLGAGLLKVGSFTRSERMAKWNECLRIADSADAPPFAGARGLRFRGVSRSDGGS
ncbi:MAG: phosphopyruvate hydratase [Rubellimicrobium sp.]|nr:phosphopyruvate hydratase [Rubellimicrobium sp.]